MLSATTHWLMTLLQHYGAAAVFIGVLVESIIIPIPSPLIIMAAGAIIIQPGLTYPAALLPIMTKIVLPGALASTLGAYFAYGVAYWGGKPLIDRCRHFLGFDWNDIRLMEKQLIGKAGFMLFILRALPVIPLSLISAAAGVLRLPAATFSIWTFAGSLPRCLILGSLGYLTRDAYQGLAHRLGSAESAIFAAAVLAAFVFIVWIKSRLTPH